MSVLLRNETFLGLKHQKYKNICPLDYSQILCDGRHSKGRKSDFSNFLVQQDIQRTLF